LAGEQGGRDGREVEMARDRDQRGATAGLRASGKPQQLPQPIEGGKQQGDQKARYHVISR
jgi:hypothetical protein